MNRLNEYFAEAEKGSCSTYCEGCLACITAYLVYMCSETHYEKVWIGILGNFSHDYSTCLMQLLSVCLQCLRKISKYIASQNERIYNPKGLQLTDPTYRGLRVIEISILDRTMRTWLPLSHSTEEFFMWNIVATNVCYSSTWTSYHAWAFNFSLNTRFDIVSFNWILCTFFLFLSFEFKLNRKRLVHILTHKL